MSVFGKTYSTNDKVVKAGLEQAKYMDNSELDRQDRIQYGNSLIDALYGGGTVNQSMNKDWGYNSNRQYYLKDGSKWTPDKLKPLSGSSANRSGSVSGKAYKTGAYTEPYKYKRLENGKWVEKTVYVKPSTNQRVNPKGAQADYDKSQFEKMRDSGKLYTSKGQTYEGITDDFYDGYAKTIRKAQLPGLKDQYNEAKSGDMFAMVNRGQGRSSAANTVAANRYEDYLNHQATVRAGALDAAEALRGDVDRAKAGAKSTLYNTESPTAGANAALAEINAITSRAPNVSPLGEVFQPLAAGINQYNNTRDSNFYKSPTTSSGSAGRIIS